MQARGVSCSQEECLFFKRSESVMKQHKLKASDLTECGIGKEGLFCEALGTQPRNLHGCDWHPAVVLKAKYKCQEQVLVKERPTWKEQPRRVPIL